MFSSRSWGRIVLGFGCLALAAGFGAPVRAASFRYQSNPLAAAVNGPVLDPVVWTGARGPARGSRFSIAPALPGGLRLNAQNGTVSGAATGPAATFTGTVTCAPPSGPSLAAGLTINVFVLRPPTHLTYPDQNVLAAPQNVPWSAAPTSSGGPVQGYLLFGKLPPGLSFSQRTGIIAGTATVLAPAKPFLVVAWNQAGAAFDSFTLAVVAAPGSPAAEIFAPITAHPGETFLASVPAQAGAGFAWLSVPGAGSAALALPATANVATLQGTAPGSYTLDATVTGPASGTGQFHAFVAEGTFTDHGDLLPNGGYAGMAELPSGRVVLAGGGVEPDLVDRITIYDPETNHFRKTLATLAAPLQFLQATPLLDGRVLFTGGADNANAAQTASSTYQPLGDSLVANPGLIQARVYHTATRLAGTDGRVVVAGGCSDPSASLAGTLGSVEIYTPDPAHPGNGAFAPGPALLQARLYHTATLLPGGKILVAGGLGPDPGNPANAIPLGSCELFDPAANGNAGGWKLAGPLTQARYLFTATLLPGGKVLAAGGIGPDPANPGQLIPLGSCELFDPAANGGTGAWTPAGPLLEPRSDHAASLLADGTVLATGGAGDAGYLGSCERFDPAAGGGAGAWAPAAALPGSRFDHGSLALPSGKVLVAAGEGANTGPLVDGQVYDPAADAWTRAGSPALARVLHTATGLADGRVLVAGGIDGTGPVAAAQLYDDGNPAGAWSGAGTLGTPRAQHVAALLNDGSGRVVVAGGVGSTGDLASTEIFNPAAPGGDLWSPPGATGDLNLARADATATAVGAAGNPAGNGGPARILVVGGRSPGQILASSETFTADPAPASFAGAWTLDTSTMAEPRAFHTAIWTRQHQVLVLGGSNASSPALATMELWTPDPNGVAANDAWVPQAGVLQTPRTRHAATLLPQASPGDPDRILVTGGVTSDGTVTGSWEILVYNPAGGGSWAPDPGAGGTATPRAQHTATLVPATGHVIITGGYDALDNPLGVTEDFDPVANTVSVVPAPFGLPAPFAGLGSARDGHTATVVGGSRILVYGGDGGIGAEPLANPEVWQ